MGGSDAREYGRLYPVAKAVLSPALRFLWRLHTTGLRHVPDAGPAIFCPNHISFFDSLVLPSVLPRRISYVGKAEYLDDWKTRHLFPALGMIPIDRSGGSASQRALDVAARILERGEFFAIYPEGTRSRTGALHRGHTGPARLALRTGAPLIPVGLQGTDRIQPPDTAVPVPFLTCQINIGRPIDVSHYAGRESDRLVLRQIIDELMYEIRGLSNQEYVDTYANAPADDAHEPTVTITAPVGVPGGATTTSGTTPSPALVTANGSPAADEDEVIDVRESSADVLSRWWS